MINAATCVVILISLSSSAALRGSSLALPLKKWMNSARCLTLPAGQAVGLRFFNTLDVKNVLLVVFQSDSEFALLI